MIFYHYTTRDAIESIQREGLTRGEAPLSDTRVVNAINLTTDKDPSGHGLDAGGKVVTEEQSSLWRTKGIHVPAGTVFANKREARITLKLPSSDPKLKRWRSWSRKNCDPGYPDRLERAAGANSKKAKTWWLYFGVVPPESFLDVEILVPASSA
ncbi:hypothetical protein MTsPCn3_28400 [Erythrobacter sp. MTPC3]